MTDKTLAALIFADNAHYLDHMAPLCAILDIPLFVTEKKILKAAKKFYPDLNAKELPISSCTAKLIKKYDCILTNLPNQMFEDLFYFDQKMQNKKLLNIWAPHGNSDKGINGPLAKVLEAENIILYYGNKFFHEVVEGGFNPRRMVLIGDYRLQYYRKHQKLYQKQLQSLLGPINKNVILFAPTWEENTLETCLAPLMQELEKDTTLIVKPHPNSLLNGSILLEKAVAKYNKSIKLILEDYPIYPFLDLSDILITDTSSVGYDFLSFNKPLILLNPESQKHKHALHTLGTSLFAKNAHLAYTFIKKPDTFNDMRIEALKQNFSPVNIKSIKSDLNKCIDKYFEKEPHLI